MPAPAVFLLATNEYVERYQNQSPGSALSRGLTGFALLMLGIGVLIALAWLLRLWLNRRGDEPEHFDFTLADLRDLHEQGQMSDEEFEAAKQRILRQTAGDPLAGPGTNPPSR